MKTRPLAMMCLTVFNLMVVITVLPSEIWAQYELCDPFVLIDPGHGGTSADTLPICVPAYKYGAPCWNNLCHEREVNLAVALRLGEILQMGLAQFTPLSFGSSDSSRWRSLRRAITLETGMRPTGFGDLWLVRIDSVEAPGRQLTSGKNFSIVSMSPNGNRIAALNTRTDAWEIIDTSGVELNPPFGTRTIGKDRLMRGATVLFQLNLDKFSV